MAIIVERHPSAGRFLVAAGGFLERREAEHNLLFGIASHLVADEALGLAPLAAPYLATIARDGVVAGAAVRTPPYRLVLSCLESGHRLEAAAALAADLATVAPPVPGAMGPVEDVRALADAWCAGRGLRARRAGGERIYRLSRVVPPVGVPGHVRVASPDDRELLVGWVLDFGAEALGADHRADGEARARARDVVARSMDRGQGTIYLWEHEGAAVSLAIAHGETPNGTRIGPVYTPPGERGHGFASAVTAAASQAQLDAGHRFVFLFTDLANPTSNKIYQAIGYEPVIDVEQLVFDPID